MSQLHEAILYHDNDTTEQFIDSFEHNNSSSDVNDGLGTSPVNDFNCDWWVEPPDSSDDTLNHDRHPPSIINDHVSQLNDNFEQVQKLYHLDDNTESEDNDDNSANIAELLQANIRLLNFLTQQSATIARLRTRIVRLKTLIYDLSFRPVGPLPERARLPTRETRPPLSLVTTYYGI